MLVENESTNTTSANALLALMCFHASRFEARFTKSGETVLYDEQDTGLWNPELISQGGYYLNRSASGDRISQYHLEAGIAYWSTQKTDTKEKWENVLQLYNRLLQIQYSPMAALNRTYALSKVYGKEEAIIEAEKLDLVENPFYFGLLGELWMDINNKKSVENFQKALVLAKTETARQAIQAKLAKI
jgi:RNA polymerase sigma-70 factor (ECF subfamily)